MARYRVNSPAVIHQTFESEVVIVNLEVGDYFSLRGSGVEIWLGILRHRSEAEIIDDLAERAGRAADEIRDDVLNLLGDLIREALIVPLGAENLADARDEVGSRDRPYARPALEKFTDMRELLLLDPIHELDEMGWPRSVGEGTAGQR